LRAASPYTRTNGRLEGKIAIVTGGGSGIGEATARLMAREGAAVVVADIDRAAAERVTSELASAVAAGSMSRTSRVSRRWVDVAVESFGGLDVLHNNASDAGMMATDVDIVDLDMAVFDRLIAVNLKGVFIGCK
jgi:NAD(P)-dependent dehydrogenase (short-subunit alcohol dehydrogenase family)